MRTPPRLHALAAAAAALLLACNAAPQPVAPLWLHHLVLKAVARAPRRRLATAEELLLALGRGAARPVDAPPPTPLARRDRQALLQAALVASLLLNAVLLMWLGIGAPHGR